MDAEPFPFLYVIPAGRGVSIFINRSAPPTSINHSVPSTNYWDDPVNIFMSGEAELRLISFYDFDVLGPRDLEYYLVRITAFGKHPHLVGRNALVRVKDTKVLHDEAAS